MLAPWTLEVQILGSFLGGIHFQGVTPAYVRLRYVLLYVQGLVNLGVGSYTQRVLQHVQRHVPMTNRRCKRPSAIGRAGPSGRHYYSRATARKLGKF